ncbi:MAG: RNA polymerase sigma factor [Bacteroidota bacterium]
MDDKEFLNDLKALKHDAFKRLLDEYQGLVFNTCLSFVPNAEDAEDVAQEVFVEVYRSISKFQGGSKLSTWLYRIAVNKSLEFIRKKNTKKRFGFKISLSSGGTPLDKTSYFTEFDHPGVLLEQKEQKALIFKAINTLPEAQRIVFTLHHIDGLPYSDISEITERSKSSVESLLFRARKRVKEQLTIFFKKEGW